MTAPICAACGATVALVFFAMQPGRDCLPWWLCGACWRNDEPEAPVVARKGRR